MFDHTTVESTAVVSFRAGNVYQFSIVASNADPDQNPRLQSVRHTYFWRWLQASFSPHWGNEQKQVTHLHGADGTAGAIK